MASWYHELNVQLADIGEEQTEVEFEPMPVEQPVVEPAAPTKVPEPTPA